jgi:hypothetical protein
MSGTPQAIEPADQLPSLLQRSLVLDEKKDPPDVETDNLRPDITEEMAERILAEMGLLYLVQNKEVFAKYKKQLNTLRARGGIRKQYDIGKNQQLFMMTRVRDDVETHRSNKVDSTIMLFGGDRPDARYVLLVKYNIPGIPDMVGVADASSCFVQVGCKVRASDNLKGLRLTMPLKLDGGVEYSVELSWTLPLDAYARFLKVTGMWMVNFKPHSSATKENKAIKLLQGAKSKSNDV